MNPGGKIYTVDEFRCWKVENLNDERSDENENYLIVVYKK
jgi:hypothetical protein